MPQTRATLTTFVARLRSKGVPGVFAAFLARLPIVFYLREHQQWSVANRHPNLPQPRDSDEYEFVLATRDDLGDLDSLGANFSDAGRLLDEGQRLCIVRHEGRPVFSAWIYSGTMPSNASPTGWLPLPADTVNLEDSIAHPDFRGSGVVAFAWAHVFANAFADPGVERIITIMHESNTIVRRAALKVGFREFASVAVTKIGCGRRGGNWRNRHADGPFLRSRARVQMFTGTDRIPAAATAADDTHRLRELIAHAAR